MADVKSIARSINKAWKEDVLTAGNFAKELRRLSVGDVGFDYALYGGLPYGNIVVFSGVEHSGKTMAACLAMAQYQKENPDKVCVYVDAENTLLTQSDFIHKMTGLSFNEDQFLRYDMTGRSGDEMFSDIIQLQAADNIGMIVIDSAPALVAQADMDNDFLKDNGQRASIAKPLGKFIKMMMMYLPKRNNILLIINQVRVDGKTFTGATIYKEPCGYSLDYYPSMKVRFGKRTFTLGDKTDIAGSKGEGTDGFRLSFSVTKNRLGAMNRGGGFITFRLNSGLDLVGDTIEIATKFNFIQRPNVQTYNLVDLSTGEIYTDPATGELLSFRGKQKLIDYLHENKEFCKTYVDSLIKYISESASQINLLDEDAMAEITKEEAAVNSAYTEEEKAEVNEIENE